MKICICGGGNLGLVCAGVLASKANQVNILTGHPEQWNSVVVVTDLNGKIFKGNLSCISSNPEEVVANQDMILLCLPGYLIKQTLQQIKPYIGQAVVGSIVSSTGFFFDAHEVLGEHAKLFGFQRVPYIARIEQYGHFAHLLGYKKSLSIATENLTDKEAFRKIIEEQFDTPTILLDSFYEAALTNSNPILHTGRLYTMFKGKERSPFDHNILFYREWTDEASQVLIDMDKEFFVLLNKLEVKGIPTLLDYYESTDANSLTRKISSIPAFQNILSPMKEISQGWVADFNSRYFTEDFPYGLQYIKNLCNKYNIITPHIDEVLGWGLSLI